MYTTFEEGIMGPIRGQTRTLPATETTQQLKAVLDADIHNRFDIEVVDTKTGMIRQRAQAQNVVCAGFYKGILATSTADIASVIAFGNGSGTPTAADTALFAQLGYKSRSSLTITQINDTTWSVQTKITIAETENVGDTITEVGLATEKAVRLMTHAMLKDQNGNTISIAKTATDIINIYATVFLHLGSMKGIEIIGDTINDVDYKKSMVSTLCGMWVWELAQYYTYNSNLVTYIGTTGTSVDCSAFVLSKSTDYKSATITIPRLAADTANFPGGVRVICIRALRYGNNAKYGFQFPLPASWYPGSNIVSEAIGTGDGSTTVFATDFIHATNATIYVNGVAASGVTVADADNVTNNIAFSAAPASGAVITADYHTSVIAKDVNHVFDLTATLNFGEYTT